MATTKKTSTKTSAPTSAKTAKAKSAQGKEAKEKTIKYDDKSAGQPGMVEIFERLVGIMKPYAIGSIEASEGTGGKFGMQIKKQVQVNGRKLDELLFAALLVQKGYVGFYYFPIYVRPELKAQLQPELLKCLKGKTCFHIKKNDDQLMEQVKAAMEFGLKTYKENNWL